MKTKILYLEIIAAAVAAIGAIFYAPDSSFKIPSIVNTMVLAHPKFNGDKHKFWIVYIRKIFHQ